MPKKVVLEDNSLRCVVDATGTLLELVYKETGASLMLQGAGLTGWKMITDLGRWREHPVFETDNEGEITSDGVTATIFFNGVKGTHKQMPFEVTITYSLASEGELTARMKVVNNGGSDRLREVWFPFCSGIRGLDAGASHHLLLCTATGSILDEPSANLPAYNGHTFSASSNGPNLVGQFIQGGVGGRYPLIYPGNASMPWMDYYNENQGWYLGYHDMETPSVALLMRRRLIEGDIQLGFCRYPFIKPGQAWETGDYVIRPHGGGWHGGADRYARFAASKIKGGDMPGWMRKTSGFKTVSMINQSRGIGNTYDAIYEQFDKNRVNGVNLSIMVFAWMRDGHDNWYPVYEPDERIGGADKLKAVIKRVRDEGGRVLLYTQGRLIDMATDYYKTVGKDICYISEDGVPYIDEYLQYTDATMDPNRQFALACPSTDEWREQLKRQIDIVMELGADGILYDQIGGDVPHICFNESHNHKSPEMAAAGKIGLLKELQGYAAAKDPDFAVIGELVCDVFLQHLDFCHGIGTHEAVDAPNPPGMRHDPSIYQYTFPTHRSTCRNCQTKNHYNTTFVFGLMFDHSSWGWRNFPERGEAIEGHLYALERLRERVMDFYNNSIFVDDMHVFCQPGCVLAKHYLNADGRHGVAITNLDPDRRTARFSIGAGFGRAFVLWDCGASKWIKLAGGVASMQMEGESAAFVVFE